MNSLEEMKVETSPVFQKKPLYYYHKFIQQHNQVKKTVPLVKHYSNERHIRIERDNLLNKMDALNRKKGFQERDTEHAVLKIENEVVKAKEALADAKKISVQRETAVKFEINHNEVWKKYYQKRLGINQGTLAHALPDQVVGQKKLIKNDEERVAYYTKAANSQWESLRNLKAKHNSEVVRLQNMIDRNENDQTTTTLKGAQSVRHLSNEVRKVKELIKPLTETLASDDHLDSVRRHNEKLERMRANEGHKMDAMVKEKKSQASQVPVVIGDAKKVTAQLVIA